MSSAFPPGPPPSDPPRGPAPGSPSGGEILEQGRGGPLPSGADRPGGNGRRRLLWAGGAVAATALVGGTAFGAYWYNASGPQPAEVLPATTLGYASLDLDPSGEQKLDALETLKKLPAVEERLGLDGDSSDVDVKRVVIEAALEDSGCTGVDYEDDIEPWLGERSAIAAVDLGEDQPAPVVVLAVTDGDAAEKGIEKLATCDGGEADEAPGVRITGDWAVVAETEAVADDVVAATEEAALADDAEFQQWTEAAGDAGVLTLYAAPEAGRFLSENLDGLMGGGSGFPADPTLEGLEGGSPAAPEVPEQMRKALEDFEGAAATVRFEDGAVELEVAGNTGMASEKLYGSDQGGDAVRSLPADTALALGVGLEEGWFEELVTYVADTAGMDADELVAEAESASGLELPEDAETLLGDSAVLAVSGDVDADTFLNSDDGSDVPVGLKVLGDPDAVEDVLDKIRPTMGPQELLVDTSTEGDAIAIGPNEEYRQRLLEDGDLGGSEKFEDVLPEADGSAAVFYLDVDTVTELVFEAFEQQGLEEDSDTVRENLEPLSAVGMSAWDEDGVPHSLFRISTD